MPAQVSRRAQGSATTRPRVTPVVHTWHYEPCYSVPARLSGTPLDAMTGVGGSAESLSVLHQRLEAHFLALRSHRDDAGPGIPIFALEHGLTDVEFELLTSSIIAAVQRRHLPPLSWLPFVVYSAEIGYEYEGDEYWQTFAARTAGWAEYEDREYIRTSFLKFAEQFGGARPSGAWAEHRTIICWPITHAVLPTDLQRQFAQLIFDYRGALTSELLADPGELGCRLAARAWHYSPRFQNFAQNTSLLGQVAVAILTDEDEETPYLLDSTLRCILDSVSAEREARAWLRDAKSTAHRVRTHGFRPSSSPRKAVTTPGTRPKLPSATDPGVFLELEPQGWAAHLSLPDLSVLAERFPSIHEHLAHLRVRVAGTEGSPLARRRLLVPGQRVRLDEWPDLRSPLLQLEGDEVEAANRLLADQCVLGPGPVWLFRIREPELAIEVRGKFVRPGHDYVLLGVETLADSDRPAWVTPTPSATARVTAYNVDVPDIVGQTDLDMLKSLGLGVVSDVGVRPAGVVPGEWDGEGAAEWLAGEDVLIAVSSSRAIAKCIFTLDGAPQLLDWPPAANEIFVALSDLNVGPHEVHVGLLPDVVDEYVAEGLLTVSVRAAHSRPSTGTLREGLMLLADPILPTLSELWDGRANVQVIGPAGAQITIQAVLVNAKEVALASRQFKAVIPLHSTGWFKIATRELRGSDDLRRFYDDAEALILTASRSGLGKALLRCERPFTPLRWVVGSDRQGPFARLINNAESSSIELEQYEFASPAQAVPMTPTPDAAVRWPAGGLLHARIGGVEASVILPPYVRDLDDLRRTRVSPQITAGSRTPDQAGRLIRLAALWASASLPADPFAENERRAVLRAFSSHLVSMIAGARWSQLEEHGAREDAYSFNQLRNGVGEESYQRALAEAIQRRVLGWEALEPGERAEEFAAVLAAFKNRTSVERTDVRFAEFLLRLASEPASIGDWPKDEVHSSLKRVIESPILVRVARFLVLAIHLDEEDDSGSTYRGWLWA
jgi:hypothetical protein